MPRCGAARPVVVALATLALAGLAMLPPSGLAGAEGADALPDAAPSRVGRYTMVPTPGGFVRLDTETGSVSQCRRDADGADPAWRCTPIPELAPADAGRIAALAARIDALQAELAALQARLDALAPPATIAPDRDGAAGFGGELMRRLYGLVRELKDGLFPARQPVRP